MTVFADWTTAISTALTAIVAAAGVWLASRERIFPPTIEMYMQDGRIGRNPLLLSLTIRNRMGESILIDRVIAKRPAQLKIALANTQTGNQIGSPQSAIRACWQIDAVGDRRTVGGPIAFSDVRSDVAYESLYLFPPSDWRDDVIALEFVVLSRARDNWSKRVTVRRSVEAMATRLPQSPADVAARA